MSQLNVTTLKHESAGVDNITLDANGRVGIGTSSPSTLLEVSGSGVPAVINSSNNQYALKMSYANNTSSAYLGTFNNALVLAPSSGTASMTIDSAGRVTMPYQPAFAYAGASYSQSTGTWSTIIPATTKLNRGGHFNGSTGVFTAPIAGFYIFGFWGLSYPHNNGETNSIQYWLNGGGGSQNVQFNGASSNHALASGGYGVYLNANDTVELRYYRGSGSAVAYSSQWNMWGYLAN